MLKLVNIVKDYPAGDMTVHALKGVSLTFRESEFVAILGHSGCGKTTLLNIVGGLDQYTSGDLVINGRSTRSFTDADWDSYRNHSVGFVFQSYNLIPHQTVLANVELALTLSGVSRAERRERARRALESVGLGDQLQKKPNQLSGGQMQRVAIARALVNDPEILMADEPTGALDSETSIQIMELLKEIAKDKLVIMVTHNPELAEYYATRTVRLSDGLVMADSDPYEAEGAQAGAGRQKRTSMGFFTALSLSLTNLMTKKGRTFLTAFAGSIGIIGIALILALSHGIQTYIDKVQEDTLSSYPITIQDEELDMSGLITTFMGARRGEPDSGGAHEKDAVYSNSVMSDLVNAFLTAEAEENNLTAFKAYLEDETSPIRDHLSAVKYTYDLDLNVYVEDPAGKIVKSDVTELMNNAMSEALGGAGNNGAGFMGMAGFGSRAGIWEEMLSGDGEAVSPLLKEQYDLLYGRWPEAYDEVVVVLSEQNELSDVTLYALGLKDASKMTEDMKRMMNGETLEVAREKWTYEEVGSLTFKVLLDAECYQRDAARGTWRDVSDSEAGMDFLYHADSVGTTLRVTGIIRPNEDAVATMLTGSVGYTSLLTDYVIRKTADMEIIKAQMADRETDVLNGLPFLTDDYVITEEEKLADVRAYAAGLTTAEKAEVYAAVSAVPEESYLQAAVDQQMAALTRESIEESTLESYAAQMGVDPAAVRDYIAQMTDEQLFGMAEEGIRAAVAEQYAAGVAESLAHMTADQLALAFDAAPLTDAQWLWIYDHFMPPVVSESSYEDNMKLLGYVDLATPSVINLYAATFTDKDAIADEISAYNDSRENEEDEISYTDYVALLMSSITTIINAISYVLIAFVAISLVVSSIMIGIITYISVLERTKEIGILRAIGASKRDISHVFNAETLIIGFVSGVLGIGITLLLTIPINAIVHRLTDIQSLNAILPPAGAAILVVISMVLTFIAGLIPSGIAARKDPVVALRTE